MDVLPYHLEGQSNAVNKARVDGSFRASLGSARSSFVRKQILTRFYLGSPRVSLSLRANAKILKPSNDYLYAGTLYNKSDITGDRYLLCRET